MNLPWSEAQLMREKYRAQTGRDPAHAPRRTPDQSGWIVMPICADERANCHVRTARVVVAHLGNGNALIQLFRAMIGADPADYQRLVGEAFEDSYIADGPSDRWGAAGASQQNAQSE
jgi:hypothetical protein